MATITDKYMKASNGTRPNPTTLTAQKGIGDAILTADDLTGWATDTPVTFVLYKIDTSGKEIINTRTDWKGIVSGNTITQLTLTAGIDTIYPDGSPVIAAATARFADDLATAMLVSHNQNGTLKDGAVGNTTIADGSVTLSKLAAVASKFSAYSSAPNTLTASGFSKLAFDTEEYDTSSEFAASRFTCTVAGLYVFSAAFEVTGNAGESYGISLYKNGSEFKRGKRDTIGGSGAQVVSLTVTAPPFQLGVNDYVEVYGYNGSGGGKTVTAGQNLTYFGGYCVSK